MNVLLSTKPIVCVCVDETRRPTRCFLHKETAPPLTTVLGFFWGGGVGVLLPPFLPFICN